MRKLSGSIVTGKYSLSQLYEIVIDAILFEVAKDND